MGYKQTAQAQHKAKKLEEENEQLKDRISKLIAALENQKKIYMNVVKAIVVQEGKEEEGGYMMNIPEDVLPFDEWQMESIPDEKTHGLIIRVWKDGKEN